MKYTSIVAVDILADNLDMPNWQVIDCRYALNDPNAGRRAYLESHIPGAVYADLEQDLSGPIQPGITGRHPLPEIDHASAVFSKLGIDQNVQVVCYDDRTGGFAARLWWMLHWLGHETASVLDGGWQAWQGAGLPEKWGVEIEKPRNFRPIERTSAWVTTRELESILAEPGYKIVDARERGRYLGEFEPIDPKSGHIPGALSIPYLDNLEEGKFKTPDELRAIYQSQTGAIPTDHIIVYCGSGVTAAHNILAMVHAGLGFAKLYAGSFSEWITEEDHLVFIGEE
jgi:thiosulfate/3-mercaptopyruvate sulfurtransferase